MGKRPRHGGSGRAPSAIFESYLRRLISEAGLAVPGFSAEDVANTLRSRHRELRRHKLDPFTSAVRRALSSLPPPSSPDASDSDSDDDSHASHPSRRRRLRDAHTTTSSTTSLSDDDSHPPPPPAFDVTKSMLRSHYASQTPKPNPSTNEQLEIEVTAEKARRLITSDGGGGGDAKPEVAAASANEGGGRGEKGPRFADLGGMEAVIEELMMEVVVPLCHPELPQRLGVRPVAGLLLHGPPGCGKTTLAHAIANETGVPFYKISAPEVVSGVSGILSDSLHQNLQKVGTVVYAWPN